MNNYYTYVNDVVNNKIKVSSFIKLACERFLKDLKDDRYFFDENKVNKCFRFISTLKHYTGKYSGQPFTLEPWQEFIVANIIGFYIKGSNQRKYSSSYIEVARKNGKTMLATALCLYFLIADGEDGAEVLLAANSKEQAKIAFEMASHLSKQLDPTGKLLRCFRADIFFDLKKSKLKVLAADDSKLDGFNCSFGLIDEYHAAKNSKVRDVIKSSMGIRESPHLATITTAGFDKYSPCYQLRSTAIEILNGTKIDDSMFIAIYSLDDSDDWTKPESWIKANPNLNITVKQDYIRGQVQQALNNPSDLVGVKTKNLNVWCSSSNVWLTENNILKSSKTININDFKDIPCYIGVDLASTSDITAIAVLWVIENHYYFKVFYYYPTASDSHRLNDYNFNLWKNQLYLTCTEGNVTDYNYITNDIINISKTCPIITIGYDSWNSTQWAIDVTNQGFNLSPISQSLANFNRPTKELERLILSNKVTIDDNPVTRYCFKNVQLKSDWNGNVKPVKDMSTKSHSSNKKIDGVIAMLQALCCYLETPQYSNEILI